MPAPLQFGLDRLLADPALRRPLAGRRVALLAHPASVTRDLTHSLDALAALDDIRLTAAFGPQHGLRGDKQDNMVESPDYRDPQHGIPVFSLYGEVRRPTDAMLDSFDVLLIDLPPGAERLPTLLDLLPGLTGAIVVTIPSAVSHLVVRRAMTLARERGARLLGLVENMAGYVCPTCGAVGPLFDGPGGEVTAAQHGVPFLGRVPFDSRLAAAADGGRPFVLDHPETPTGQALTAVAAALVQAVVPA